MAGAIETTELGSSAALVTCCCCPGRGKMKRKKESWEKIRHRLEPGTGQVVLVGPKPID